MWIIWNDDPGENVDHISEHGLLPAEVEFVLENAESRSQSHSSGVLASSGTLETVVTSSLFLIRSMKIQFTL